MKQVKLTEMQRFALRLAKSKDGVTPHILKNKWYEGKRVSCASRDQFGRTSACYKCLRTLEAKGVLVEVDTYMNIFKKAPREKVSTKVSRARRRYYLHQRIKEYFQYKGRMHHIEITQQEVDELPEKVREYLFELRDKFRYNLQFQIEEKK